MKFTPNLTRSEVKSGLIAMALCLFVVPGVLDAVLGDPGAAMLNFTSFFISAAAIVYILRRFLLRSLRLAMAHPFYTVYYACLGYLAHMALTRMVTMGIFLIDPGFLNLNDQNVTSQLHSNLGLMAVTTVVLAPIAEECFFRGLLFRGFYDRSPVLAWAVSMGLFAAIHVVSYIGTYSPLALVLAFVQYLPAGAALCFAYRHGGTILSPILAHAIINGMALYTTLR